jgi:hypothetical protein
MIPLSGPASCRLVGAGLLLSPDVAPAAACAAETPAFTLHEREYFTARGLDVLVFNNAYEGEFSDAKISGIELIHHGVRIATNGDVRLNPTPEQWDPAPTLRERVVDRARHHHDAALLSRVPL